MRKKQPPLIFAVTVGIMTVSTFRVRSIGI